MNLIFLTRDCCVIDGEWPTWLKLYYCLGSISITSAYVVNPILLGWLLKNRNDLVALVKRYAKPIIILYLTFILACGFAHVIGDVMPFWYPNYELIAHWYWFTDTISWACNWAILVGIMHGRIASVSQP